ncbi:hypothetical protein [Candidatus Uabimicrobium amorphum]|uniref:Uncharacterized protein n=1 Tax=Uabimicrobium amorphum TaxID=2596890 RepID=A0A5S9IVN1_UABAM|nr:hypothetical protein [Candidatus Uabimicrobium amorphum]BBM88121.1 hypothetical protein UABAM_06537 [Candidatus Uabimicrobium amorphum]
MGNMIGLFVVCGVAQMFFPWWSMAVAAFIFGFVMVEGKNDFVVFAKGFCGVALLWICVAALQFFTTSQIIATRISDLFSLPHPALCIAVCGVVGGVVAGIATFSGCQLRQAMFD